MSSNDDSCGSLISDCFRAQEQVTEALYKVVNAKDEEERDRVVPQVEELKRQELLLLERCRSRLEEAT